jgi:hypothetical protein
MWGSVGPWGARSRMLHAELMFMNEGERVLEAEW